MLSLLVGRAMRENTLECRQCVPIAETISTSGLSSAGSAARRATWNRITRVSPRVPWHIDLLTKV